MSAPRPHRSATVSRAAYRRGIDALAHSPIVEVVGALVAGGLGLPIPEELALVNAGYWLSRGVSAVPLLACTLAALAAGDAFMVLAGRCGARFGFARRCLGAGRLVAIERAFARHGVVLLACGRFVPGVRASLLVAAGAARVSLVRVALADGAAALAGAATWIAIGWRLGAHVDRARTIVGNARGVVMCVATVAIVIAIVREASRAARSRASQSRRRATHS